MIKFNSDVRKILEGLGDMKATQEDVYYRFPKGWYKVADVDAHEEDGSCTYEIMDEGHSHWGLIRQTDELFEKCLETLKRKNTDYAGKGREDGLHNFEVTAKVAGISREQGILVRLMDKMTRIGNLLEQDAQVKEESIKDTLEDAINYCAILYYAIEELNQGPTQIDPESIKEYYGSYERLERNDSPE